MPPRGEGVGSKCFTAWAPSVRTPRQGCGDECPPGRGLACWDVRTEQRLLGSAARTAVLPRRARGVSGSRPPTASASPYRAPAGGPPGSAAQPSTLTHQERGCLQTGAGLPCGSRWQWQCLQLGDQGLSLSWGRGVAHGIRHDFEGEGPQACLLGLLSERGEGDRAGQHLPVPR